MSIYTQPSTPTIASDLSFHEEGVFVCIFCYHMAGKPAKQFQLPVYDGFFLLVNDYVFIRDTNFLSTPFKIWDSFVDNFVDIPMATYWLFPSTANPFLIVKNAGIEDADCPGLDNLISQVADSIDDFLNDLCSSSPLPPSSPPPLTAVQVQTPSPPPPPPLTPVYPTHPLPLHERNKVESEAGPSINKCK
ncbi:hypothetical protein P691DRAFT_767070 [Macrolepiota fuliginosa MF-IS2]|uniref:Uncharacterized protein n=1 Tax=Macrolepiota fuliginosa MF-IS2 TaxID=1400762 RepID=A0A9P6BUX9_9AGAR|nr:hypothetical protein P691DRAFT_767070 [Macrolepiota fuliginosa MF-IS2]